MSLVAGKLCRVLKDASRGQEFAISIFACARCSAILLLPGMLFCCSVYTSVVSIYVGVFDFVISQMVQ